METQKLAINDEIEQSILRYIKFMCKRYNVDYELNIKEIYSLLLEKVNNTNKSVTDHDIKEVCKNFNDLKMKKTNNKKYTFVHIGKPLEFKKYTLYNFPGGWYKLEGLKKKLKEDMNFKAKFTKEELKQIRKIKDEKD